MMLDKFFKKLDKMFDKLDTRLEKAFDIDNDNYINFITDIGTIIINGKKYNGKNIKINNGEIIIDGKKQNNEKPENYIFIINGDIKNIVCTSVTINGNVTGDIDCTSCTINGDIIGDIDGTSIKVNGKHKGKIK